MENNNHNIINESRISDDEFNAILDVLLELEKDKLVESDELEEGAADSSYRNILRNQNRLTDQHKKDLRVLTHSDQTSIRLQKLDNALDVLGQTGTQPGSEEEKFVKGYSARQNEIYDTINKLDDSLRASVENCQKLKEINKKIRRAFAGKDPLPGEEYEMFLSEANDNNIADAIENGQGVQSLLNSVRTVIDDWYERYRSIVETINKFDSSLLKRKVDDGFDPKQLYVNYADLRNQSDNTDEIVNQARRKLKRTDSNGNTDESIADTLEDILDSDVHATIKEKVLRDLNKRILRGDGFDSITELLKGYLRRINKGEYPLSTASANEVALFGLSRIQDGSAAGDDTPSQEEEV